MWIPPIWVRRVVIGPLVFVVALLVVVASPLLFAAAVVADLFVPGRWRVTRVTRLAVVFSLCEVLGLLAALGLWLASGFGAGIRSARFRELHYRLLGWWLRMISRELRAAFGLGVEVPRNPPIQGPVLVFSRHAGPGDSIFLASALLGDFDRHPRIVGKKELEFSPFFDVMGHRLPMRFIRPHPKRRDLALDAIRDAASGLGPRDAFVLFPEGGNFTPRRRERAIAGLERRGLDTEAERARALQHLLPPHPAGASLAIDCAAPADVVFVAHTGTEDLVSLGSIWGGIPFGRTIRANYWHVPAALIPADPSARTAWLFDQWAGIDAWIGANREPQEGEA